MYAAHQDWTDLRVGLIEAVPVRNADLQSGDRGSARSQKIRNLSGADDRIRWVGAGNHLGNESAIPHLTGEGTYRIERPGSWHDAKAADAADRKSTRLNSSH